MGADRSAVDEPPVTNDRRTSYERRFVSESGSEDSSRIVVGIDGSEGSKYALRWAVRQAGFTGAGLEAITGWQYPAFFGLGPVGIDDVDFGKVAEQTLTETLDEVLGADRPDGLVTRAKAEHPAVALVDASRGAELLVVGSRGYGGLADALLGSVSTYCVHHAHCPVTVIRPSGHGRQ
jgi:nucleotide-binding universal stress UspA family protein